MKIVNKMNTIKIFMTTEPFGVRNAVRLTDGCICGFDDSDLVIPVEAHIEITKKGVL